MLLLVESMWERFVGLIDEKGPFTSFGLMLSVPLFINCYFSIMEAYLPKYSATRSLTINVSVVIFFGTLILSGIMRGISSPLVSRFHIRSYAEYILAFSLLASLFALSRGAHLFWNGAVAILSSAFFYSCVPRYVSTLTAAKEKLRQMERKKGL